MRAFLLWLVLATSSVAEADVIPPGGLPAPPTCPPGSSLDRPLRGHGWICTEAARCTADTECRPGAHCEETALCIVPGDPSVAYGACGPGDACTVGSCARASRCVAPPPPPPSPPPPSPPPPSPPPATAPATAPPAPAGGLCRASPASPGGPALLVPFAVALAWARRRSAR